LVAFKSVMALDADVRAALAHSHFASLPDEVIARLTTAAVRVDVPAGTDLIAPGSAPRLLLIVAGVAKTYLIAPNRSTGDHSLRARGRHHRFGGSVRSKARHRGLPHADDTDRGPNVIVTKGGRR